jgi:hypothetical protein
MKYAMSSRIRTLLASLLLVLTFSCGLTFAQEVYPESHEQPQQEQRQQLKTELDDDMAMFALLEPPRDQPSGMARWMEQFPRIGHRPTTGRPLLVWYHWANQRKPFLPSLLFILFFSVTISSLMPHWTANAQSECKTRFWRTFFHGCMAMAIGLIAVRFSLMSKIGWPAAIILMGLVQITVLCGLSVLVLSVGQSVGTHLKLDKFIARHDVRRLTFILLGALVCALLLQIPGFGPLPRIGTRLVALLALVGVGGLVRTRRQVVE